LPPSRTVLSNIEKQLLDSQPDVEAILLVGSTAFTKRLFDWDDLDVQVYTRGEPGNESYYEILNDGGRHYLLSAYYSKLGKLPTQAKNVLQQRDVQIIFGREESLRRIFVDRPQRTERLPHELGSFKEHHERYFEILVDVFFILNRYEARGKGNTVKPRLARDALRTLARHYYGFYGVNHTITNRGGWRSALHEVNNLLDERRFENLCQNRKFVRTAINLISQHT
jgi:hypothetical protein